MKRLRSIVLSLLAALTLLSGCGQTDIEGHSLINKISDTDTLLPFEEDGSLIWEASDFDKIYLDYCQERKDYEAVEALTTKADDISTFVNILSDISKILVYTEKASDSFETTSNNGVSPPEIEDYSNFIFYVRSTLPDKALLQIFKAEDCGYLWFRLENRESEAQRYHSSVFSISLSGFERLAKFLNGLEKHTAVLAGKPVLYLYPENESDITVKLRFEGTLSVTYPAYDGGWNVRAYPDGRLINYADGQEYSYLFWEGFTGNANWDLNEGYCIAGADTVSFLQQKLKGFSLTPKEYNEFIVYWLPQMQGNPYNLITFQWDEYERISRLEISPEPDSIIRVFMVFAPLQQPVEIAPPANRQAFVRNGFTVVEWGALKIPSLETGD